MSALRDGWQKSCMCCNGSGGDERERLRQLQLLALIEHPDALPSDLALRLAQELLTHVNDGPAFRCDVIQETQS